MTLTEKFLGKGNANDTDAHSIYSPPADTTAIIKTITLTNKEATPRRITVYLDNAGATYNDSTTILNNIAIPANDYLHINGFFVIDNSSGNLAYMQGTAGAITIQAFGAEIS